ncbi:MAG: PQQ-dependent sugar dehydrogenase [Chloroflexi bacterium]|nr:PQQ-dependent sugar dehydrogenase [Chloroflexota bacterium]
MTPTTRPATRRLPRRRLLAAGALAAAGLTLGWPRVRGLEPTGDARVVSLRYEPELGHNIATLTVTAAGGHHLVDFLGHYFRTGGLRRAGLAISEPIVENGVLCQYFQRGVLESRLTGDGVVMQWRDLWTVLGDGEGAAAIADIPSESSLTNPHAGRAVGPYGHVVSNQAVDGTRTGFLELYDAVGGELSLGAPLTAARLETEDDPAPIIPGLAADFVRQYFEAGVMEVHPQTPGAASLALVGDVARDTAYTNYTWTLVQSFDARPPLAPGRRMRLERTERPAGLIQSGSPIAPPGFELSEFADTRRLGFPAVLRFAPDGRLFVAFSNDQIVTMRDSTGNGRADAIRTFASGDGVKDPRGLAFVGDHVYVSVEEKIIRLRDASGSGAADESADVVTGLELDTKVPFHRNNGIAIGPDGLLYMTLGSTTNSGEIRERPLSASILRSRLDGTGLEKFATGLRNPFGLAFSPDGELFCTDNGPDTRVRRNDDPPDELNHVIEGADYGHARFWGTPPPDSGTRGPVANLAAHGAAAGLTFFTGPQAGEFDGNVLIAMWGPAGGRSSFAHNILRARLRRQGDTYTAQVRPFVSSLTRPTDVVVGPHGDLYIADHVGRTIYRLRRRGLAPSVLR